MAAGAERGGRLIFGLNRGQFESYAFQYVLVHLCLNNHTSNTQHTFSSCIQCARGRACEQREFIFGQEKGRREILYALLVLVFVVVEIPARKMIIFLCFIVCEPRRLALMSRFLRPS